MNRDNFLFAVIGILIGFIAGYLLREVMAGIQAPRAGTAEFANAQAARPDPGQDAGPPVGPQTDPSAPAMAEVQALQQRLAEAPNDVQAIRRLADLNYNIRNWQRSAELYERYLTLAGDDADVISDLGVSYRGMGEFDRALELFARARTVNPDHWRSIFNEIVVYGLDLGRYDEAQSRIDELKALQPDDPDVARLAAEIERRRAAA